MVTWLMTTAPLKSAPEERHTGGKAILEMVLPPGWTECWSVKASGEEKTEKVGLEKLCEYP